MTSNQHDPLDRQEDGESRFVLLARDPSAPDLVRMWLAIRKRDLSLMRSILKRLETVAVQLPYQPNKTRDHILSAERIANEMELWQYENHVKGIRVNEQGERI